jgi:hypothetical protein
VAQRAAAAIEAAATGASEPWAPERRGVRPRGRRIRIAVMMVAAPARVAAPSLQRRRAGKDGVKTLCGTCWADGRIFALMTFASVCR